MQLQEKSHYEKFLKAFHERYKDELEYIRLVPESELIQLYLQFKNSGKTPEQWLEQQELT